MMSHGAWRAGLTVLDLACMGCGRLDAFLGVSSRPVDMAAGIRIVSEAGGAFSDMRGGPVDVRGPHLLADNAAILAEMAYLFAEIFSGRYRFPMPEIRE